MAPWGKAAAGPSGAVTSDAGTPYGAGSAAAATPKLRTETRSRCCCCHVARGLLLALLSLCLLGTLGTSVASLALGPNDRMTTTRSVVELEGSSLAKVAESGDNLIKLAKSKDSNIKDVNFHSGYLGFKDSSNAQDGRATVLKELGIGRGKGWAAATEDTPAKAGSNDNLPWIIGYVLMAMLLASIVAALIGLLAACCCGCSGCGLATFAIPFGLALAGVLLAYWVIVNLAINRYAHDTYPVLEARQKVFQKPQWAWYLGLISSGLWLLAGSIGCCMPKKTKTVTTLV